MVATKSAARQLVALCKAKNIKEVVISPGSRNAPLIVGFTSDPYFKCLNIPDERAAAFTALGMSKATGEAVVLICTSGSAVLNYYPAVAEAFYQNIPLIVLSADRPPEWIDQADGQTIRQDGALRQHTVFDVSLRPEPEDPDTVQHNNFLINKALETALNLNRGPVHLNVPFREPLYGTQENAQENEVRNISYTVPEKSLSRETLEELQQVWDASDKIMVLAGMQDTDAVLTEQLNELGKSRALVFTETLSNIPGEALFPCIDRLINTTHEDELQHLQPDLLITTGKAVVSKMVKKMLRKFEIKAHWHIDDSDFMLDTYRHLTRHIPVKPRAFFDVVDYGASSKEYPQLWRKAEAATRNAHADFISRTQWCDLKLFASLSDTVEEGIVHLANSSPVRYAQLFNWKTGIEFFGNRGTSGIDGSISTAAGHAMRTNKPVWAVTGDVSFLYDSNALFHNHLPDNLRIIVINNGGGNIFRILPGPRTTKALEEHFESNHNFNAKGIAANFWVNYLEAHDEAQFNEHLKELAQPDYQGPVILEVFTPRLENDAVLKKYFKDLYHAKNNRDEL